MFSCNIFAGSRRKIGITLVSQWWEPLNDTPPDKEAVERAADFMFGWYIYATIVSFNMQAIAN